MQHRFETETTLPLPREEVFPFFADAANLERITPAELRFRVLSPGPIDMRAGARIDYQLRLFGVPFRWKTEITRWEPPHRFTDSQLAGPYRSWIHTHTFDDEGDQTRIFRFRERAIREALGLQAARAQQRT